MRNLALCVSFLLATLPLSAQSLLHSYSLSPGLDCTLVRPAGDTNGDGKADFVAVTRQFLSSTWLLSVVIASGATGAPLHTLTDPTLGYEHEVVGIGDVNGDSRSDVLLVTEGLLRIYSGSTGAVLASLPNGTPNIRFGSGCGVGDYNGNGTADVVVGVYDNTTSLMALRVLRGENLSLITTLATLSNVYVEATLRAIGDLTGDGKTEIAICDSSGSPQVLNGSSGSVVWSLLQPGSDGGRAIDALDLDGDGKREVFFFRPGLSGPGFQGMLSVHDAVTGAQRFARQGPVTPGYGGYSSVIAGLGDLDQDGVQDFAETLVVSSTSSSLVACSGAGGRRLWALPNWPPLQALAPWPAPLGDVDGDTFGDLAVMSYGYVSDGWQVISGRILAESQPQAGACGGGPFFPQLGASRPILGQVMTIAGQNGPAGVGGLLVFSLQPPAATWLGASTCYAYLDLGGAIVLAPLAQPQWSLPVPMPLIPQIAGIDIALQSFFAPTSGPLGLDLSNGVWARLGYQ